MRLSIFLTVLAIALGLAGAEPAAAEAADNKVILEVDGGIPGGKATFSRGDLEAMPQVTVLTTTPWHDGVQTFEGVSLEALMAQVGAGGRNISVIALNRYRTEIPGDDFARHGPILAIRRNGQPMDVKDKGPLFVIFPFDAKPELRTETYYGRSAWQVRRVTVQ
jgi:hypothetical protein